MEAGTLKHRLTFAVRSDTTTASPPGDGFGNYEGDWVDQFTVWGRVQHIKGREEILAQRLSGTQPVSIVVRASGRTGQIRPHWRVTHERTGEAFNVRSIMPSEDSAYIDLLCESGVAV